MTGIKTFLISALFILPVQAQTGQPLLTGVQRSYYADGQVEMEQEYKEGKMEGFVREYYPNGKLAFLQGMTDGKINGDVRAYFEDGTLKGETHYVNNYQDGISKEYYPTGLVKEEVAYIDGQMMDLKQFDEQGHLVFHQTGKFGYGCAVVK